ncbi:MotA/TolQ/ExbB proton channel family protein [Alphaproteobacteria bacterium]|nr:MotA/TolQ/ExbB proton channel family protein [Alphaproteobacteria bacterium]
MATENDLIAKFSEIPKQKAMGFDELLSTAINSTIKNEISLVFVALILFIFISVIAFPKSFFGKLFSSGATTVLPSIGILGTFVGVFIALLNFQVATMQSSITLIIGGLKVAFITSIFGLTAGIIVKLIQSRKSDEDTPDGVGAEEILTELQFSRKETERQNQNLINAISGDADSSLNTQMKLMRSDLNDFAKTVAEANTTAFIDALKAAIADFNKNLTEQFGENFKRLNEAVGKLLEWQENNKKDMEDMRTSIDTAVKGIDEAEISLTKIKESAETIPETVSGLTSVLEVVQAQIKDMENHLQAFAEVSNQAKDALPRIEEVLTNYTDGLEKTSSEILANLTENLQAQEGVYTELQTNFKTVFDDFGQLGTNLQASITEISETLSSKTEEIALNLSSTTSNVLENFTTSAENSILTIGNNLETTSNTILTNLSELTAAQNEKSLNIIDEFTNVSEGILTNFKDTSTSTINNLSEASKGVVENATTVTTEHSNATREIASKLSEQVDTIGKNLSEKLEASVVQLSTSFNEALKEAEDKQRIQISSFTDDLSEEYKRSTSEIQSFTQELLNASKEGLDEVIKTEMQGFSDRLGSIAESMSDQFGKLRDAYGKAIEAAKKLDDK